MTNAANWLYLAGSLCFLLGTLSNLGAKRTRPSYCCRRPPTAPQPPCSPLKAPCLSVRGAFQSRWSRLIPLAGALALMTTYASAQGSPTRHPRGGQHILTPEEKQIDNDYKAATSKIPDQKPNDPWGAIRPAPSTPSPKTPTGAGAKKTQQ
jgi:hypothetical protein